MYTEAKIVTLEKSNVSRDRAGSLSLSNAIAAEEGGRQGGGGGDVQGHRLVKKNDVENEKSIRRPKVAGEDQGAPGHRTSKVLENES